MTMTKEALISSIREMDQKISRAEAITLLNALLEIMKQTLENGEDIMISRFGKFCVKEKNGRNGRNPATKESLFLEARRVVVFRCSPLLKQKINES